VSGRFTLDEIGAVSDLLRTAGRAEVMPRFRALPAQTIRTKSGPLDLVTDADIAAERQITAGLVARFPGCLVVGEEAAADDPSLLARLAEPGLAFVVDPIDGTANYAAGMPLFGMMAAVLVDGVVVAAAIHDPVQDETMAALRNGGAWCEAPDQPRRVVRVSAAAPFGQMTGSLAWRFLPEPRRSRTIQGALGLAGAWDFRCAAHQYRLVADGKIHFSLYSRLLPWDHAAGWLLHREAGGYSARFDGSPYDPLVVSGGLICAPDQASWTALRDGLL
jgi:fructose-1,6-bisphosphatase/inositol monophosphatase family enzyme